MNWDWNVGTIIGLCAFLFGVIGSITRVLIKQNSDAQLLQHVDREVKNGLESLHRHETEIAVLKESFKNIDKKLDEIREKLK